MLLVGIGLLPLALFGGYGAATTVYRQKQELERSTLELSRALASAVDSELDATVESLQAMAHSRTLANGDLKLFHDTVEQEVAARRGWAAVILTDADGVPLFKTGEPYGTKGLPIVDMPSLQRAIATREPTVGSLLAGPRGTYAFPVRVPVFVDGKVAYVLSAAVKPDRFAEIVNSQNAPAGWIIAVFDRGGLRVARSRGAAGLVGKPPGPSLTALLAQPGLSGVGLSRTAEDEEVYTGFTRVKAYGWTVAVGASTAGTTAILVKSLGLYMLGTALSVLACGLFAARVTRRVTQGIRHVRDQAVRVGAGEAIEPSSSPIAEIDEMATALHAASKRLEAASASTHEALARADAASRTKDEFLAILGHELRNPLAPMLTALHLMDAKSEPATLRERQIMRRQINHMRRLVDDLLDVSRIARGTLQILREPVELRGVVERAVETVQPILAAQQREIDVRLPARPVWIDGDETRLVQAITNLLTNGVRFGGQAALSLAVDCEPARVHVRVSDHGVGMNANTLARIFEPFYQAPQPLARTSGGLGLGLAIVKTVIELHGGEVHARSDGLGSGSSFEIVLPTIETPAAPGAVGLPERAAIGGRVLVVDDNADSATTLADALAAAGHELRVAFTAAEALAVAEAFQPQVAILDIGLPDMDGYQLAARLRQRRDWRGRLVALTGYGQAADKEKARAAGFDRHFTKPADPASLLAAVDEGILAATAASLAS
jgi:signal transduction histidine kinase/ActR/RegA family two-component response regulator